MARLLLRRLTPSALAPSSSSSSCAFLPTARNFDHGALTSAQGFRCFSTADEDLGYQSVNRRPYNLEAKMRMKQYRREAEQQRRQMELEEEARTFELDYSKMYKKGDPGTVQGVIKGIHNVGYFVDLPNGREGFLAAMHLGCSGGIPLLERLMKVGTEVAVRVIPVPHPGGRDRCYVRP